MPHHISAGLRAQGTRIGVLTTGNQDQQLDKLRMTGLAPLIDIVCVSEEIGYAKLDQRAFEIFAERLATAQQTRWHGRQDHCHRTRGNGQQCRVSRQRRQPRQWRASSERA